MASVKGTNGDVANAFNIFDNNFEGNKGTTSTDLTNIQTALANDQDLPESTRSTLQQDVQQLLPLVGAPDSGDKWASAVSQLVSALGGAGIDPAKVAFDQKNGGAYLDYMASTWTQPETAGPETNAPATNAPATNAPATNAPATNAPATNAPATNAPVTNAPTQENTTPSAPFDQDELNNFDSKMPGLKLSDNNIAKGVGNKYFQDMVDTAVKAGDKTAFDAAKTYIEKADGGDTGVNDSLAKLESTTSWSSSTPSKTDLTTLLNDAIGAENGGSETSHMKKDAQQFLQYFNDGVTGKTLQDAANNVFYDAQKGGTNGNDNATVIDTILQEMTGTAPSMPS